VKIPRVLRWAAGIFLAALLGLSIWVSVQAGAVTPPKYWVVFGLLAVAAVGYRFRWLWLRQLTLLGSLAYLGFYLAGCPCTTGSFEMVFVHLGMGEWARIGIPLLRVAAVGAVVFLLGNLFCGWVCFKGALQEFLYRRHLAVRVPPGLDRWLKRFRYLILAVVVAYPLVLHTRIFNQVDPFRAAMNFTGTWFVVGLLVIVLASSVFVFRPFCRYACPLGAFLGLINKVGLFKLRVTDPARCVDGKICVKSCPMQGLEKEDELKADKAFCIACMECAHACPKNCLK